MHRTRRREFEKSVALFPCVYCHLLMRITDLEKQKIGSVEKLKAQLFWASRNWPPIGSFLLFLLRLFYLFVGNSAHLHKWLAAGISTLRMVGLILESSDFERIGQASGQMEWMTWKRAIDLHSLSYIYISVYIYIYIQEPLPLIVGVFASGNRVWREERFSLFLYSK